VMRGSEVPHEDRLLTAGMGQAAHPRTLREIAEQAERLGFGTLWAPEHVALFDRYPESKYPYSQDGAFAGSGERRGRECRRSEIGASASVPLHPGPARSATA
jgi:alkanesulfonate monooxygenase SsuD/methylene tetrahydromethanopterin reductase-like flavin-dependent oxidoreductase (luciferase family)